MKQDRNHCRDLGNLLAINLHDGYSVLVRYIFQCGPSSFRIFFYLQKKGIRHVFEIDDTSLSLSCPARARADEIRRSIAGFVQEKLQTGYFLPYMQEFEEELKEAI